MIKASESNEIEALGNLKTALRAIEHAYHIKNQINRHKLLTIGHILQEIIDRHQKEIKKYISEDDT